MNILNFCYIITFYEKCFKNKNKIENFSEYEYNNNNIYFYGRNNNDDETNPVIINGNIYTECVICYEITTLKDIKALYPCGHRLYCDNCIIKLKDKCPNCNTKIHSFIKIYENLNEKSELLIPNNKNNI